MNATIGAFDNGWIIGASGSLSTGLLRELAHRHTRMQTIAGASIGIGANFGGRLLRCTS